MSVSVAASAKSTSVFGIAGQQRRERGVSFNAGLPQAPHGFEALGDGGAMRLVEAADIVAIGGNRKAHPQVRALRASACSRARSRRMSGPRV